jgi:hypothetical protein
MRARAALAHPSNGGAQFDAAIYETDTKWVATSRRERTSEVAHSVTFVCVAARTLDFLFLVTLELAARAAPPFAQHYRRDSHR